MDENRRKSEQLKIERDLFPHCIQAPMKYFNRNKTLNENVMKKYKRPYSLPGEITTLSPNSRMEVSKKYVFDWFEQNEKSIQKKPRRKPFDELNKNCNATNEPLQSVERQYMKTRSSFSSKNITSDKCQRNKTNISNVFEIASNVLKVHDSDIIDLEAETSIDQSQTQELDKDQCALMEVHRLENKNRNSFDKTSAEKIIKRNRNNKIKQLKNSISAESSVKNKCGNNKENLKSKIDNDIKPVTKTSKYINKSNPESTRAYSDTTLKSIKPLSQSVVLDSSKYDQEDQNLNTCKSNTAKKSLNVTENSDEEIVTEKCSFKIEVKADVHRSSDLCDNTLKEVKTNKRRSTIKHPRPASSDSSEKENYDPNRCSKRLKKKNKKYT